MIKKHFPFLIGAEVIFQDWVFEDQYYAPSFVKYKDHTFTVDLYLDKDESRGHIYLVCSSDPSIIVDGCVHISTLKEV